MLADTKELVAAGKTNVIGGFVGSPLSFQSVSDVVVSHKLGGTNYIMVAAYSLIVLATIDLGNGDSLSVRTMRAGAVVGEMALFTGAARSATALAKEDCTLCKLSVKTYRNLQKDHPTQVGIFHTYIIQLMSDRLSRANREIVALSR